MLRPYEHTRDEPMVGVAYEAPVVDQLHLPLDELREGDAEEPLLPFHAACGPDAVEEVARLGDGGLEIYAVYALALEEAVVGIGIGELGNELALEAQRYRRIERHDGVKLMGGGYEFVVCELEGGELVEHMAGVAPFIGDAGVEVGEFEELRAVEHTRPQRYGGPVEIALRALYETRGEHAREGEGGVDAELVAVEDTAPLAPCLPFIIGVELHSELLGPSEEVAVGDAEYEAGAEVAVRLRRGVDLDGCLHRVVKLHDVVDIEHGMSGDRVDRHGLDLDVAEYAEAREACLSAVHVAHGEELPLAEGDARWDKALAELGRTHHYDLTLGGVHGVGGSGIGVALAEHGGIDIARAVLQAGHLRHVVGQGHLKGHGSGSDQGIGEKLHILRAEIVIATVAHGVGYPYPLSRERVDAEYLPLLQIGALAGHGVDETIDRGAPVVEIDYRVDRIRLADIDGIFYRSLLAVALVVDNIVGGGRAEIAVVVEDLLHELHTHLRTRVAYEAGLRHEFAV